jgi:hypothetical protein
MSTGAGVQISSGTCSFVMAAVSLRRSQMEKPALYGQFCQLTGYGQGGTGFAHPGR